MRTKITFFSVSILITLLLLEVFIRVAIAADLGGLRNPDLFFNNLSDDEYWKHRLLWTDFREAPKRGIDPELGWVTEENAGNPLGIIGAGHGAIDYQSPAILFVGDSYIGGIDGRPAGTIPTAVGQLLPEQNVYNLGVPGYGVGQSYLRMRQASAHFTHPFFVFGILTFDLDRSILNVFSGPKPRLELSDSGELIVHNRPITQTAEAWLQDHPPAPRSYLLTFTRRTLAVLRAKNNQPAYGLETRVEEKQALNAAIMARAAADAAERQAPLVFLLFYTRSELTWPNWREEFLAEQCRLYTCLDTMPVLLRAAAARGVETAAFYTADGLHLNEAGNAVVAAFLSRELPVYFSRKSTHSP